MEKFLKLKSSEGKTLPAVKANGNMSLLDHLKEVANQQHNSSSAAIAHDSWNVKTNIFGSVDLVTTVDRSNISKKVCKYFNSRKFY